MPQYGAAAAAGVTRPTSTAATAATTARMVERERARFTGPPGVCEPPRASADTPRHYQIEGHTTSDELTRVRLAVVRADPRVLTPCILAIAARAHGCTVQPLGGGPGRSPPQQASSRLPAGGARPAGSHPDGVRPPLLCSLSCSRH